MLTIGQIDYLNCFPIFSMLRSQGMADEYRFVRGVPSELNQQLRDGSIDICPSSSIEFGRHPERYFLLPDLSISADGPVKSVMLFADRPMEELDGQCIELTGESATSAVLLKILLAKSYGFTNTFLPFSGQALTAAVQPAATLLIGDRALRAATSRSARYIYDLGDLWHRFTGLPFVFALWLVQRDAVAAQPAAVSLLLARLLAAKAAARQRYPELAGQCLGVDWLSQAELVDYWQTISYDLTERHQEGVRLYFRYAAECGLIAAAPELAVFAG